jgi:hypothetical protein
MNMTNILCNSDHVGDLERLGNGEVYLGGLGAQEIPDARAGKEQQQEFRHRLFFGPSGLVFGYGDVPRSKGLLI